MDFDAYTETIPGDTVLLTKISYITGPAGSGKSYQIRKSLEADQEKREERNFEGDLMFLDPSPAWGRLCATTGVAAMNLGTITLHSLLKIFKPDDFLLRRQKIARKLEDLNILNLVIDEISMLSAEMLDAIVDFLDWYNEARDNSVNLILTGDFAQLPPVEGRFAFQAKCWERVQVTKLTKIWRQDNPEFLQALGMARLGLGKECSRILSKLCEFVPKRESDYPGLCLVATKSEASSFNTSNLERLVGDYVTYSSSRWGDQLSEWKDIPDLTSLKQGCKVRIRANETQTWAYVNGDTGILTDPNSEFGPEVLLDRTSRSVNIQGVTRYNDVDQPIPGSTKSRWVGKVQQHYVGSIDYLPLEAGYASTVHSCQGLTLDSAQVSLAGLSKWLFNKRHFGFNMAYVALSRVKTPEKLRIHGTPGELAEKIRLDSQVNGWI